MIDKRLCSTFAALLVLAAVPAFAEPVKSPASEAERAASNKAPVVFASADETRVLTEPKPHAPTAPRKPVTPRVTNCRCGDSDSGSDTNDQ